MSIRVPGQSFNRSLMQKIYENTLLAAGKFDVTGIPPSYDNLIVRLTARTDETATSSSVSIFFNNDTTDANYERIFHVGGSTTADGVAANSIFGTVSAASSPANYFGIVEVWIPHYAKTTFNKICECLASVRRDTANGIFGVNVLQWENVAAINRITIQADTDPTDELVTNSTLQIYGVR